MSPTKRIILNTVATYGRTLFGVALGLFSSRWVLMGLGEERFGLFGVVGGIISLVCLLNFLLAASVGRSYAYAIGESKNQSEAEGEESLTRWFCSAFTIYMILPILLVGIGYVIGSYAIEHWLKIPAGYINTCIWVFRFSLFMSFMSMISVPYIAMYQARQLIAELSIWGVVTTLANFAIAYYMLYCPGDRLLMYGLLSALAPSLVFGIQIWRARKCFSACHIRLHYLFDRQRLVEIFRFAFWDFFGWLGASARDQGSIFVINRKFGSGPIAAYRVTQSVIHHATTLSNAILGALHPAITTAVGQGDFGAAKSLTFRACKFGSLMMLFFAIPIFIEIDEILRLWLVNPPEFTSGFCRAILVSTVVEKFAWGHHLAILALGRIAYFQTVLGLTAGLGLVVLLVLIAMGLGPLSVGYMFIGVFSALTVERVIFARRLLGLSIWYWILRIFCPLALSVLCTMLASSFFSTLVQSCNSILRICSTGIVSSIVLGTLSWMLVLDVSERKFIVNKVLRRFSRSS